MKKGCGTLFLVIGAIITLGLLLRLGQYIFKPSSNTTSVAKTEKEMQELIEASKIKNLYGGRIFTEQGRIEPRPMWPEIVPGEWELLSIRYFKTRENYWLVKGDVTFSKNFNVNLAARNIRGYDNTDTTENEAKMIAGGGFIGKWELSQDEAFIIKPEKCDFHTSLKNEGWFDFPGCPYFEFPIGNASDAGWTSEVKAFNRDTIITVVEDFRYNSKQYFYLTRIR